MLTCACLYETYKVVLRSQVSHELQSTCWAPTRVYSGVVRICACLCSHYSNDSKDNDINNENENDDLLTVVKGMLVYLKCISQNAGRFDKNLLQLLRGGKSDIKEFLGVC